MVQIPPAASLTGDIVVKLDSGQEYQIHKDFLHRATRRWEPWRSRAAASSVTSPIQLANVTDKQFLVLLHAVYVIMPNSSSYSLPKAGEQWADAQAVPDLLDMAAASHAMGCIGMLAVADQALMKQSCAIQSASELLLHWRQAWQLGLVGTQQRCTVAVMKLLPDMSREELAIAAELVPCVLAAVSRDAMAMFAEMHQYQNMWYPHASMSEMLCHAAICRGAIQDRIPPE